MTLIRDGTGPLRILLADEDEVALERLSLEIRALGHEVTGCAVQPEEATRLIAERDPDAAVVMVHRDAEHALELIDEAVAYASGPVLVQISSTLGDPDFASRAAVRGIDAVVSDSSTDALRAAIDVAVHRWRDRVALSDKVEQLETALERRAVIERAKGILMERHSVSERQAFALLRDHARARSRSVLEVAAAVAEGHGLLPATRRD